MKRIAIILAIVLWVLALPVSGQETATPTETSTPIPTATSYYTRPTPTPWAVGTPDPAFDDITFDDSKVANLADNVIQAYAFVNQTGAVDLVIFAAMAVLLIGLLSKLIRSGKQL